MSAMSAMTAEAVASPPAPGPTSISSCDMSASIVTALMTPSTSAIGERLRHQRRMHALLDALVGALRDAEQLDAVAEFVRRLDVGAGDALDALDIDRFGVDLACRRQRRQDRQLVGGVEAADVEGRIGFGVTEPLRLAQAHRRTTAPSRSMRGRM